MKKRNTKSNTIIKYISIMFLFVFFIPIQIYAQESPQNTSTTINKEVAQRMEKLYNSSNNTPTDREILLANIVQSMEITTSPINPKPHDKVSATITNYSTDLDRADISWYENGVLKERGMGKTNFTFTIGGFGISTTIEAVVNTVEGFTVKKKKMITPEEIDIMWEADTYTPPFYKGKALLSVKSKIKLIAMPNFYSDGKKISSKNLIYIWRKNSTMVQKNSGYGKNIFYDESPVLYDERKMSVEVSSFDKSITAYKAINLVSGIPEILFYKNDPLEGVLYRKAIQGRYELSGEELSLRAEPYFFSKEDKDIGNLVYKWYINDNKINNLGQNAIFRQESKKITGFSRIKIQINNLYRKYQKASNSFILSFN